MKYIQFEWDESKNKENIKNHGISFAEAETVFYDQAAKLIHDPDHSYDEDRFVIMGISFMLRLLIVVHCYRKNDEIIRIISARKATNNEKSYYGG